MSQTQPKLDYACTPQCSFRPEVIGPGAAAALLAIRASGAGARVFSKHASEILGRPVNQSSVQRHLKHYRELEPLEEAQEETIATGGKVTDLEILDRIIAAGARNAKNWEPTIGDTLKAMEMKLRLTGNSAFEDMLAAMAAASTDEDEGESSLEAPEARFSEDERASEEVGACRGAGLLMAQASFVETWRSYKRDSVLFLNALSPKKPHHGQVRWLRNSTQPINVLVPGNRWGKSTIIAMKHIWKCVFKIGLPPMSAEDWRLAEYETISVAQSADQAEIVFKEAKRLLQSKALRPLVKAFRSSPFPHIIFTNGAIMHCRSAHDDGKYVDATRTAICRSTRRAISRTCGT